MKTYDLIMKKRLEIRAIVENNRCTDPKLFGSVVRGEDTEESDIDILITPLERATLLSFSRIQNSLEKLLGKKVDLTNNRTLLDQFRPFIEREMVDI